MSHCKIVTIGDKDSGKIQFFQTSQTQGEFTSIVQKDDSKFEAFFTFNEKFNNVKITLMDSKIEEYDWVSYLRGNVFLLFYSVISKSSFENVSKKWIHGLKKVAKSTPIILIATDIDKRNEKSVTLEQGKELANEINATEFFEISNYGKDVNVVINRAIEIFMESKDTELEKNNELKEEISEIFEFYDKKFDQFAEKISNLEKTKKELFDQLQREKRALEFQIMHQVEKEDYESERIYGLYGETKQLSSNRQCSFLKYLGMGLLGLGVFGYYYFTYKDLWDAENE